MYSNYRIIQYTNDAGEVYYQIQQVHYNQDGIPVKLFDPQQLQAQNTEVLKSILIHQISALTLPILDSRIFQKEKDTAQKAIDILKGKTPNDDVQQ